MRYTRTVICTVLLNVSSGLAAEEQREARTANRSVGSAAILANAPDPEEASDRRFGGLVVSGNDYISDETFYPLAEAFYGEELTDEALARLVGEIAELAKENGFPFAEGELLNDGSLGGIVEVFVDEGYVDETRIEGYQNARALKILRSLEGKPAVRAELERKLLLLSEIPAVRYQSVRLEREEGRSVLIVKLRKRSDRVRLEADNYGTSSFGPIRAKLSYDVRGLLDPSDEVRVSVRTNPLDVGEFKSAALSYETQVGDAGTRMYVGASFGDSAPGGRFDGSGVEGQATRGKISLTQPLVRTKNATVDLEAGTSFIRISQDAVGDMLRDDTVVTASIGMLSQVNIDGSRLRARVRFVRGLDLLGATRAGDPLSSRRDGDGVFSAVEFWADARVPIGANFGAYFALKGQVADRPLLSSEEFALGGAYRLRGYDFREVSGDNGVHALAELRYDMPNQGTPFDLLQLYAFIEGGQVWDIDATGSEGTLFSTGPGVRARLGRFDFELEAGIPLGGSGEKTPNQDPELNVRAGFNF